MDCTEENMQCSQCLTQQHLATRLPHGWKRKADSIPCAKCWKSRYTRKGIIMPVVGPINATWNEFGETLTNCFQQATAAANWMISQLFSRYVVRTQEMTALPPIKRNYLYPEARIRFPEPPSVVTAIERSVTRKYLAKRYEVIWLCSQSLPNLRYPYPLPIPSQAYDVEITNGAPCVKFA